MFYESSLLHCFPYSSFFSGNNASRRMVVIVIPSTRSVEVGSRRHFASGSQAGSPDNDQAKSARHKTVDISNALFISFARLFIKQIEYSFLFLCKTVN